MYAIKARIRKSRKADKPGTIVFSIREGNTERLFTTGIHSTEEELTTTHREMVLRGLKCLYDIIERFNGSGKPYDIDDIADKFRERLENGIESIDISNFKVNRNLVSVGKPFNKWIVARQRCVERYFDGDRLNVQNLVSFITYMLQSRDTRKRNGTISNYKSTGSTLSEFIATLPKNKKAIDQSFVSDFSNWLKDQNLSASTASFYLKMFKSVLNKAKEMGVFKMNDNWFAGMIERYEPNDRKNKENALSKTDIRQLANIVIKGDPLMELSRDLFMFSFYCRGMELFDILNLTPENIQGNYIIYNKRLTGKQQIVAIDPQAKKIINKYIGNSNGYIFSAITRYSKSREYNTLKRIVIPKLLELCKLLGIKTPITFSAARNTWNALANESRPSSLLV